MPFAAMSSGNEKRHGLEGYKQSAPALPENWQLAIENWSLMNGEADFLTGISMANVQVTMPNQLTFQVVKRGKEDKEKLRPHRDFVFLEGYFRLPSNFPAMWFVSILAVAIYDGLRLFIRSVSIAWTSSSES